MDQNSWWQSFFTPNIWDLVPLAGAAGSVAVIAAVKKFRDAWAEPLRYGLVGGGVIFVCLWIPAQSYKHLAEWKQIGGEQVKALDKVSNTHVEALEQISN